MKMICPYCQSKSSIYFHSKDFNRNITQETFDHYLCSKCNLIFIEPIPLKLADYYPGDYHSVPESSDYLETNSAHESYKIEIVQNYASKGKLLEIGPSYGSFTYLAKKAGFEVDAIEMNIQCCQFLNEVIGVNAINSDNPISALQQLKSYDVITLWHVLEHLPDPWATLDAICTKLSSGGILVLSTPNPSAFQFKIMGRYWPHIDAPRHLMLIPMSLLVEKMNMQGMEVELITTSDQGSIVCNIFGWETFFKNFSSEFRFKKILRLIGRMVGFLFSPIEKVEGKGSAYTMVLRKKDIK